MSHPELSSGMPQKPVGGWDGSRAASQVSPSHPTLQEERGSTDKARHFLESAAPLAMDPYSCALTTYALTLLRSPVAPEALRKLRSLAIMRGRCPWPSPEATASGSPLWSPVNNS